jgi:multidrug efflux pump subunit AcrA (membrane-fusion protein)
MRFPDLPRRKLLLGGAVAAAVLIALLVYSFSGSKPAKPEEKKGAAASKPALTVTVTAPEQVMLPVTLTANGNLAAWQEASVGAEASGLRIAQVRVNVGDRVRRGQVLATFASDTVRADLAQARAALAEAEASAAEAASNATRARSLQATGALSASQINQYVTAEKTAQARVQAAQAQFQAQQVRLGQTAVHAPDDGVISARSATVGAVVPNGTELFRHPAPPRAARAPACLHAASSTSVPCPPSPCRSNRWWCAKASTTSSG